MTKLQQIEKNTKSYTLKRNALNVLQCLTLAILFTIPAWAYLID